MARERAILGAWRRRTALRQFFRRLVGHGWPLNLRRQFFWMCALVFAAFPIVAWTQTPGDGKEKGLNPAVAEKLATVGVDYIVSTYGSIANSSKPFVDAPNAKEIGQQGTVLLENYHKQVRDGSYGAQLLHGTFSVTITAGTVGGSSTVIGAPAAIAIGVVAQTANNAARDYLVGDVVTKASAALGSGIQQMTTAQRQTMDALLKAEKYDEAARLFEKSTKGLSTMRKQVAGDKASERLLDYAVAESLRKGTVDAIVVAGKAASGVADLQGQFTKHVRVLVDFTEKTEAKLEILKSSVTDVQKDLDEVRNDLGQLATAQESTNLQVQIIQDVMFDQQPPGVKLQMLAAGAYPNLTEGQRSKIISALKVQDKQRKIVAAASTVVSYARDISTIMGSLGVTDPRLDDAVRYGTAATTALEQAFSGNYLGAIASVSGLFGNGSRQDSMQENMKKIFLAFSEINKRLETVLELQIKTLEGIEALSKQMAVMQERIDERFDRVDFELAKLNEGLQVVIWEDLNVCERAWKSQDAGGIARYDRNEGRFKTFDAMWSYTASHGDTAYKCYDKLSNLFDNFRSQKFSGNPMSLSFVKTKLSGTGIPQVASGVQGNQYGKSALQYYESKLHAPSYRVLRHGWDRERSKNSGWGSLANAYALLSSPTANAIHLRERVMALKASTVAEPFTPCRGARTVVGPRIRTYLCSDTSTYVEPADTSEAEKRASNRAESYLAEPMLRDQVGILMQYAMFVSGPREIAKSDAAAGAYTIADLVSMPLRDSYGRMLLTSALMVSDASIAQQAMLYGDLTAWFVFELLWDPASRRFRSSPQNPQDATAFADARELLRNESNPWLQHNVLMLILQSVERDCNSDPKGQACVGSSFLYRLAHDRFFSNQGKGRDAIYAPMTDDQQVVAEAMLKNLFAVHPDTRFLIEDSITANGQVIQIPRRLLFKLDGYSIQMPSVTDWTEKRLVYPPQTQDRIDDRIRVARRLANYSMLDGMAGSEKTRLITMLSKGSQP